jgi:hypothetical protein
MDFETIINVLLIILSFIDILINLHHSLNYHNAIHHSKTKTCKKDEQENV